MKSNDLQYVYRFENTVQLNGDNNMGNGLKRRVYKDEDGRDFFKFDKKVWYMDELEDWGIIVSVA